MIKVQRKSTTSTAQQGKSVELPVTTYDEFFDYLYAECEDGEYTYLPWSCTPDKDEIYSSITNQWSALLTYILRFDKNATVQFNQYVKKECFDKQGIP